MTDNDCDHPDARTLYIRGPRSDGSPFVPAYDCCEDCGYIMPRTDYKPRGPVPAGTI